MRGEWIEIVALAMWCVMHHGLSPCGESGLKSISEHPAGVVSARLSPCGESGLKSLLGVENDAEVTSLPMWGEWIEICVINGAFG